MRHDLQAACVQADHHPFGAVGGQQVADQLRVLNSRRAQHYPTDPQLQQRLGPRPVPDTAADLHRRAQVQRDVGDDGRVLAAPGGGVEVDQMQQPGTQTGPVAGSGFRRLEVDRLTLGVALVEPHGAALLDIHAGHDQGRGQMRRSHGQECRASAATCSKGYLPQQRFPGERARYTQQTCVSAL